MYFALKISGSDNETVEKKLYIQLDYAVNKILHEVDKVSSLLDENVEEEKYDQVKKLNYNMMA